MTTQEIVSKLWNLCNVLRDDGITYHQYVTELTYILFLKMAKETDKESKFAEGITLLLCKQAAKIFQTICKKETALKRVLRNLLSAISFAQI